jgi:hypothetical protein
LNFLRIVLLGLERWWAVGILKLMDIDKCEFFQDTSIGNVLIKMDKIALFN